MNNRSFELDYSTFTFIASQEPEYRIPAALHLPEPWRKEEISKILKSLIETGNLETCQKIAKFLDRDLTPEELHRILYQQLDQSRRFDQKLLIQAGKTAVLLPEPDRSEQLIGIIEGLMSVSGWIRYASEYADLLPEPKRTAELNRILAAQLAHWMLNDAHETARRLNRGLTAEEITKIYDQFVNENNFYKAREAAGFLPLAERSRAFQDVLLRHVHSGQLQKAQEIAGQLGRGLTDEELMTIIERQVAAHFLHEACLTATFLSEPKRTAELKKLLDMQLQNGHLESVSQTANWLAEPERSAELLRIFQAQESAHRRASARRTLHLLFN